MKNQVEDALALLNKNSLESSLKPLVALLNIIGLHVPISNKQGINPNCYGYGRRVYCWILGLYGCILPFSQISFWIYKFTSDGSNLSPKDLKPKESNGTSNGAPQIATSTIISIIISSFNEIGYSVIIHSSISITIWLYQFNWKLLWINLREIEINMNLDVQFYQRTTKMCRILILSLLGHTIFFVVRDYLTKNALGFNIVYWTLVWMTFNHFIIDAILTLFYILVSCSVDLLALLDRRLKALIIGSNCKQVHNSLLSSELEKWRRHHIFVCQFIEHINACFGLIIITFISYSFISFITCCYLMYDSIDSDKKNVLLVPFTELLQKSIQMLTFIGVSVKIKSQVNLYLSIFKLI
jgi:hypothetical protein